MENAKWNKIVSNFMIQGTVMDIKPLGAGLINDTFVVKTEETETPNYVLQRINHAIFQDVEMLMSNIEAVTQHLRMKMAQERGAAGNCTLTFISTREEGRLYFVAEDASYWRMMEFIPDSFTQEVVNPDSSYAAGLSFGAFQALLVDLPVELGEVIPNFHNMEFRLQQFREAVAANPVGRLEEVIEMVEGIESRAEEMCKAERWGREGILPKRVCHCDTKVNNLLFDKDNKVVAIIDLDTIMPSFIFSDYGDFLRTGANTGDEDDSNLAHIGFNRSVFEAFTKGYLKGASSFLTSMEIENLPYAVALFPYMQCVRFLTDYINGDVYYKIKYPDHNLVRTKAQFRFLQCVEEDTPYMEAFIKGCLG
ncbi:MAG: phosphotransferase enzyme family protein [Phocaeicola sp.]